MLTWALFYSGGWSLLHDFPSKYACLLVSILLKGRQLGPKMDITKPNIIWIKGRCYRLYGQTLGSSNFDSEYTGYGDDEQSYFDGSEFSQI